LITIFWVSFYGKRDWEVGNEANYISSSMWMIHCIWVRGDDDLHKKLNVNYKLEMQIQGPPVVVRQSHGL